MKPVERVPALAIIREQPTGRVRSTESHDLVGLFESYALTVQEKGRLLGRLLQTPHHLHRAEHRAPWSTATLCSSSRTPVRRPAVVLILLP